MPGCSTEFDSAFTGFHTRMVRRIQTGVTTTAAVAITNYWPKHCIRTLLLLRARTNISRATPTAAVGRAWSSMVDTFTRIVEP